MIQFDIDDQFENFMRMANPRVRETDSQYKESRRVFYAGCAAIFYFLTNEVTTLSDEDGFKQLDQIKTQLEHFAQKRVGFSD
jgi:hypothetical protein